MRAAKMSWRYIAGFFDGEGHFAVREYDNTKYNDSSLNKGLRAEVSASQKTENRKVLVEISNFLNKYNIQHCFYDARYQHHNHCKMSIIKMSHKFHIKKFLKKILPFLVVKRQVALQVLQFCKGGDYH